MHKIQRIHQITAGCFIAFAAYIVWSALGMEYYTNLGPGPGFFPFWLGSIFGGLGLIWLAQVSLPSGRPADKEFLPGRDGIVRILMIVAALVMVTVCMNRLGFQLTMFLFLVFTLRLKILGQQPLWIAVLIALLGSFGVYYVFGVHLDVILPKASWEWLANLGL